MRRALFAFRPSERAFRIGGLVFRAADHAFTRSRPGIAAGRTGASTSDGAERADERTEIMAQTRRTPTDNHILAPTRAEIFEAAAQLDLAQHAGAGDGDGGRGGFPFRMLAASYGVGLVLAITAMGAGFGMLTVVLTAWLGGVATMTALPFAIVFLDDFIADMKERARSEAHREATLQEWNRDANAEASEARMRGTTKAR
jgi:hypothetical protein